MIKMGWKYIIMDEYKMLY